MVVSLAESEKVEGADQTSVDVVENHDDSQFFNLASKVLKKFDSKPKADANKTMPTTTTTSAKEFKSPKAKLPLQIVV